MERAGKTTLVPLDLVPDYAEVGWKEIAGEESGTSTSAKKKSRKSLLRHRSGENIADSQS